MERGRFITFEGGEGTGKSTQVRRLTARLTAMGLMVVATREPGGTPGAEALRDLLVRGPTERWSPLAEALILNAARTDHLERLIRPALERGDWVICDRFADSTRAYQGAGGEVDAALIAGLEAAVVGPTWPDLTLILNLEPELGLERARVRPGAETRFERKDAGFHVRLRAGFLAIAQREPDRCRLIDASPPVDEVEQAVWAAVASRLTTGPAL